MTKVLLTAFRPYDRWKQNASWSTLVEVARDLPDAPRLVTRLYPVDFEEAPRTLAEDLRGGFDYAVHLGQAPGSHCLRLEAIALNVRVNGPAGGDDPGAPLAADGPLAYQTTLPVARWAGLLREAGVPAMVSHHAGSYLCNAIYYHSLHLAARRGLATQAVFIHLPLGSRQAIDEGQNLPALPEALLAQGVRLILQQLTGPAPAPPAERRAPAM